MTRIDNHSVNWTSNSRQLMWNGLRVHLMSEYTLLTLPYLLFAYNESKTKYMCIKPAVLKNMYVPNVELNGKALELVAKEIYVGFFVSGSFMMMTM